MYAINIWKHKRIIFFILLGLLVTSLTFDLIADTEHQFIKDSKAVQTKYFKKLVRVKLTAEILTAKPTSISLFDDPYTTIIPQHKNELLQHDRLSNKLAILYLDYQIYNLNDDKSSLPVYQSSQTITREYLEKLYSHQILYAPRRVLIGYLTPPNIRENDVPNFTTYQFENVYVQVTQAFVGEENNKLIYPHLNNVYDRISMMKYMTLQAKNRNAEFVGMLEILDLDTNVISYVAIPGNQNDFLTTLQVKQE